MAGRVTELTELTAPTNDDLSEIVDLAETVDTDARNKKITRENYTKRYSSHHIIMEVPNDTVAYPDIFTLGDGGNKISGIWLPNSGTSSINAKIVIPQDLHGTPAAKIAIYMMPRTSVANSTVNLRLKRLYVNTTEDADNTLTEDPVAGAGTDVEITSTADFLTIYEFDLEAEATEGELFEMLLTRTPSATNDDFTEDLFIVWMELRIYVVAA